MLEGEIEITLGGETRTLGPGGLARVDAGTVRDLRNLSSDARRRTCASAATAATSGATACPTPEPPAGRGSPSAAARPRPAPRAPATRRLAPRASTFNGLTTKKKITAPMIRNDTTALKKWPYLKTESLIVNCRPAKSGLPPIAAISGVTKSATNAVDDRSERGADDHRDGEVDDVAAQDELAELLQHGG